MQEQPSETHYLDLRQVAQLIGKWSTVRPVILEKLEQVELCASGILPVEDA